MKLIIVPILIGCLLIGCMKDDDYDKGLVQSQRQQGVQKIIEVGLTAASSRNFLSVNLVSGNTDTTFTLLPVRLASSEPAPEDIEVTLEQNDALVDTFNSRNGTSYAVPAASKFTVIDRTVIIPKGSYVGYMRLKVKPSDYLGVDHALGYTIKTVAPAGYTISGNLQNGVVAISILNAYDGVYSVRGTLVDMVVPEITGSYPLTWELRTTSGSANEIYDRRQGTQTHLISSGGAPSQYGSFGLNITFDPATNKIVSVVNSYGQPAPNGRSAALDPSGVNAFDPVTRTIRIKYFMLQPGTTVRTTFDEVWTYTGRR